jgi:hypothetical protein
MKMKFSLTAAAAGLILAFSLAACSEPTGDAAADKPATEAAQPSSEAGAPVRDAEIRPVTGGRVAEPQPSEPVAEEAAAVEPTPAPVVESGEAEVRDAKSAAEEAARKFFDATRDAATAIKEAGRDAVESVRGNGRNAGAEPE